MLRRLFLTALARKAAATRAPEDPDAMNVFAAAYNRYVTMLHAGIVDPRQWARVTAAWNKL